MPIKKRSIKIILLFIFFLFLPSGPAKASVAIWADDIIIDKPQSSYNPSSKPTDISLSGAKGEWLAFYVMARPSGESIGSWTPSVISTLTSGSNTIADSNLTYYMVQNVTTALSSCNGNPKGPGQWPDPAVPYQDRWYHEKRNGNVSTAPMGWDRSVANGNTQLFLVEVFVPPTTANGTYDGTIRLDGVGSSGHEHQDINISLNVWNFTLPLSWTFGTMFGLGASDITNPPFTDTNSIYDLLVRSGMDHGIWLYNNGFEPTSDYPDYGEMGTYNSGADFNTTGFSSVPGAQHKNWLKGAVSDDFPEGSGDVYNPRPYYGMKPVAYTGPTSVYGGGTGEYMHYTQAGSVTSVDKTFTPGEHVYQTLGPGEAIDCYAAGNNGPSGSVPANGPIILAGCIFPDIGAPDNHTDWIGQISGAHFTPTGYAVVDKTMSQPLFDSFYTGWADWIANPSNNINLSWTDQWNGQSHNMYFVNKDVDEPEATACCDYPVDIADMMAKTSANSYTWTGVNGLGAGCFPWAGSCDAASTEQNHMWWITAENQGLARTDGHGISSPRDNYNDRINSHGDKVWTYNGGGNYTYNSTMGANGQESELSSSLIDTAVGGRENAALAVSLWAWKLSGFHYWESTIGFNGNTNSTNSWLNPNVSGWNMNGNGFFFYPGVPNNSAFGIGGTDPIPIESLRMKLFRYGMNILEYANLLGKHDETSIADAQIRKMYYPNSVYETYSGDPSATAGNWGTGWGTVSDWESARDAMGEALSTDADADNIPASPTGLSVY